MGRSLPSGWVALIQVGWCTCPARLRMVPMRVLWRYRCSVVCSWLLSAEAPHRQAHRHDGMPIKRVRVAPGKHIVISDELAAKATRAFATGLTREQVVDPMASEPRHAIGLMAGSKKPLALSRSRERAKGKTSSASLPHASWPRHRESASLDRLLSAVRHYRLGSEFCRV